MTDWIERLLRGVETYLYAKVYEQVSRLQQWCVHDRSPSSLDGGHPRAVAASMCVGRAWRHNGGELTRDGGRMVMRVLSDSLCWLGAVCGRD